MGTAWVRDHLTPGHGAQADHRRNRLGGGSTTAEPLSSPALETPGGEHQATCEYRDALEAVLEALDIPHAATVGHEEIRNRVLLERVGHTVVMLSAILDGEHLAPGVPWSVAYLRARLAEHPAQGYKTWDERMAELDAAKTQDGAR